MIQMELQWGGGIVPIGTVLPYAGSSAPSNYLICDGTTYSRDLYEELYNIIGITYGNTTGNNFAVPNLQTRVPIGSNSNYILGSTGGETTHTLTTAEMPTHNHVGNYGFQTWLNKESDGSASWPVGVGANTGSENVSAFLLTGTKASKAVLDYRLGFASSGGSGSHNNMQPYLVLNYIIRAK